MATMSEPRESLDISDLKDTFLECPVCVEHFNQTDRRPRLLHSCLHAFCTQCLEQLLVKEGKGQITCPLCRQVQRVKGKVDTLRLDPVRGKLVEYVQIKHKQRVICGECEENDAVSRCQECQSYLCKDCDYVHRRHRVSRDHQIISLEEVLQQPVKSLSKGHFCPSHPKHHLEFYCSTEEQLCCVSCTVIDHKGHDLQKLDEAAAKRTEEVESQMKKVCKLAEHLKEARQEGTKQEQIIASTKAKSLSDLNSLFDNIKMVLDERKRQLVAIVHDKSNSLMSTVKKTSEAHDQTLAIIESTDTYFTQAKEKADFVEMLQMYPAIKRSIESLQQPKPIQKFDAAVADFTFIKQQRKEMEELATSLGGFGQIDEGFSQGRHIKVRVYKADITKLKVDVIVNAANGFLSHGAGVSRAIADAAGPEMTRESLDFHGKYGIIKVSHLAITSAGKLPYKKVFHAVGPEWYKYTDKHQCLEDLCFTILRCLCEAETQSVTSIAIPSISSAIFRVPKEDCARMYVRALRSFDRIVESATLKEVHFVDVSEKMVSMINKELEDSWCKPGEEAELKRDRNFIKSCLGSTGSPSLSQAAAMPMADVAQYHQTG